MSDEHWIGARVRNDANQRATYAWKEQRWTRKASSRGGSGWASSTVLGSRSVSIRATRLIGNRRRWLSPTCSRPFLSAHATCAPLWWSVLRVSRSRYYLRYERSHADRECVRVVEQYSLLIDSPRLVTAVVRRYGSMLTRSSRWLTRIAHTVSRELNDRCMTVGDILIVGQPAIAFQFRRNIKIRSQLAKCQMVESLKLILQTLDYETKNLRSCKFISIMTIAYQLRARLYFQTGHCNFQTGGHNHCMH